MPAVALAAEPTVIEAGTGAEFISAVATANATADEECIIKLTGDIETNGASFSSARPTTIIGNGHTITLSQYASLSVQKGAQLKLGSADGSDTLTISGGNVASNDVPGLLYIQGDCDMYSGVTIADREGNNYFGGGVTVQGGTFRMHGGTIENCGIVGGSMCYGGGVAVIYGGSFVMDGGTIKNCYVTANWEADWDPRMITALGGGVFVSGGSSFVMNGGSIENNSSTDMGGGVAVVASVEEVSTGFGTLKSSAEILGGTIEDNEAHDGGGVFASGYYYAGAWGLCADTPSIGTQEKQGLRIDNARIVGNKANEQGGRGGGVFAVMLKSPAGVQINATTITNNSAATGGGIMSYGYYTAMSIDGSTIAENKATLCGGGFAADSNTGELAGTTVKNTKLCNNTAEKAASDVYLNDAVAKLPSAESMSELYLGKPDDATNCKIDGWYIDEEEPRYATQAKDERVEYADYENAGSEGAVYLIAATSSTPSKPDDSSPSPDGDQPGTNGDANEGEGGSGSEGDADANANGNPQAGANGGSNSAQGAHASELARTADSVSAVPYLALLALLAAGTLLLASHSLIRRAE